MSIDAWQVLNFLPLPCPCPCPIEAKSGAAESDSESDSDSDGDGEVGQDNQRLKSEVARHKAQLEALRQRDPEFFAYLQQTDEGLLGFGGGEDSEDEEVAAEEDREEEEEEMEDVSPNMARG